MKKFITVIVALMASVFVLSAAKPKAELRIAEVQTNIHCKNCAAKVQDNIAFEKGVEDLKIDVPSKKVTITYNPKKTDVGKLVEAIKKLGYTAEVIEDKAK